MADHKKINKDDFRNSDLFSFFNNSELEVIAENSSFRIVRTGENVFSEGDISNELFIIEYGEIVIQKPDNENRIIDIARFLKGDCFGELDMLSGSIRNASAQAEVDSGVIVFPGNGIIFQDMLEKYPEISARILHKFLVQIAGRIRKANSLVSENSPVVQELSRQVYRDKLTGRYNKTYLEEKLSSLLDSSGGCAALLMVKPDNFKLINDSFGHDAGDHALRIITRKLHDYLPDNYLVVRYMGNELSVYIPGADRDKAFGEAEKIRDYLNALDLSKVCSGAEFKLSVSQGIAVYPEHTQTAEKLILLAHELPLVGRGRGGNKILFPEDLDNADSKESNPSDSEISKPDDMRGR